VTVIPHWKPDAVYGRHTIEEAAMSEPTAVEHDLVVTKINRRTWVGCAVAVVIIVGGGAAFDQIPEFIGKAVGALLMFAVIGGAIYVFCSPVGKAKTRFWTTLAFSVYCLTFPLREIANRAGEEAFSERAVAAYDRGIGESTAGAPSLSGSVPPNPASFNEVIVSLMEALATRTSDRQSRYLNTLSALDLDAAIAPSQLASADGRADTRSRIAQFDQATAEFAHSQGEDMKWVAEQLAAWNIAPTMSARIIENINRGRDKTQPAIVRWLDIQAERVSVMTRLVDLREKPVVGDSDAALRQRLIALAANEQELGRAQAANNEQVRQRLSR
jgi:hypothetical protein